VEFVVIDLSNANSVRSCAADVLKRHSLIDILVNAAGWNDIQLFTENRPDWSSKSAS
jgi:short-subunit dehydrogenase